MGEEEEGIILCIFYHDNKIYNIFLRDRGVPLLPSGVWDELNKKNFTSSDNHESNHIISVDDDYQKPDKYENSQVDILDRTQQNQSKTEIVKNDLVQEFKSFASGTKKSDSRMGRRGNQVHGFKGGLKKGQPKILN